MIRSALVLILVMTACTRSPEPEATAPANVAPAVLPAPSVRLGEARFTAGDRIDITSRVTLAQGPVRIETTGRYEIRIDAVDRDQVRATIVLTEDETVVQDGERRSEASHRRRTIQFRGKPQALTMLGRARQVSLLATYLPEELLRDGVSQGATWTGSRTLDVAGLPLELDLHSRAAILRSGRVAVTTTSHAERTVELGVQLRVEGEAVTEYDPTSRGLPRSIRGTFTTTAAGGSGADARSTVAVEIHTRRVS